MAMVARRKPQKLGTFPYPQRISIHIQQIKNFNFSEYLIAHINSQIYYHHLNLHHTNYLHFETNALSRCIILSCRRGSRVCVVGIAAEPASYLPQHISHSVVEEEVAVAAAASAVVVATAGTEAE